MSVFTKTPIMSVPLRLPYPFRFLPRRFVPKATDRAIGLRWRCAHGLQRKPRRRQALGRVARTSSESDPAETVRPASWPLHRRQRPRKPMQGELPHAQRSPGRRRRRSAQASTDEQDLQRGHALAILGVQCLSGLHAIPDLTATRRRLGLFCECCRHAPFSGPCMHLARDWILATAYSLTRFLRHRPQRKRVMCVVPPSHPVAFAKPFHQHESSEKKTMNTPSHDRKLRPSRQ